MPRPSFTACSRRPRRSGPCFICAIGELLDRAHRFRLVFYLRLLHIWSVEFANEKDCCSASGNYGRGLGVG